MEENVKATQKEVENNHSQLIEKINGSHSELNKEITERIDKIVENNLKIEGIIDDPEGKDSTVIGGTLKDYIIKNIQNNDESVNSIRVIIYFKLSIGTQL